MSKERIDTLLVLKELATDIKIARSYLIQDIVLVNDVLVNKAGTMVKINSDIRLKKEHDYVSRGALKLQSVVDRKIVDFTDKVVIDIGCSTGGFTEVALRNNASKIYSVDVGVNLIHERLKNNPKVNLLEGINFRYIDFNQIGEKVDILLSDLSFISLKKIIPKAVEFCKYKSIYVALIKPQFEAKQEEVMKGGIVQDPSVRHRVIDEIEKFAVEHNFEKIDIFESPIKGRKGNVEYISIFSYNHDV